jgi:hypothetical protein
MIALRYIVSTFHLYLTMHDSVELFWVPHLLPNPELALDALSVW